MNIKIKRIYEAPSPDDGYRVLIDRIWPRGISKEKGEIDTWAKEVAPSSELRKWYNHDHNKWEEFKQKYFAELEQNQEAVAEFRAKISKGAVTFLFSSKELKLNNAYALKEFIEKQSTPTYQK